MPLPISMFVKGLVITSGAIAGATAAGLYWKGPKEPEGPNENDEINGKIKALGIENKDCLLKPKKSSSTCQLSEGEMKKIGFPEKTEGELKISGMEGNKKVTLTIEKDYSENEFPHGLRLTFNNPNGQEIVLGSEDDSPKKLKPNIGYDYKISTSDATKIFDAWSLQILGGKVGMTIDSSEGSVCQLAENQNNKVNVWKNEKEYVFGADLTNRGSTCQMDVAKDTKGYLEGFKFTVKGNNDIALSEGTGPDGGKKIEKITKNNVSYEIGPKNIGGTKKWFLIERNS